MASEPPDKPAAARAKARAEPRPPPAPPTTSRRLYLFIAAGLVVVAIAAVIFAANTDPSSLRPAVDTSNLRVGPIAPAVNAVAWINSPPLPPASLTGNVVLYDFWTYSCVNCVRTIPYLQSWYNRYRADGLVIVGIHSPEFDFERVHANVERAVKTLGVTWPVALDDKMTVWDAFQNNSWPADYIADTTGHLRYATVGEGGYAQTEDVLRSLLKIPKTSPRAASPSKPDSNATSTADITPETYLGVERGTSAQQGAATYPDPGAVAVDTAKLSGAWTATAQYVQADSATSAVVLHYQAREVNLVLAPPPNGPAEVDVVIELDGMPLPPAYRTVDTVVNAVGQTTVAVTHADMYKLVFGPTVEGHTVRIIADAPGLQAYSFTFGA